jgi:hypothetical protein
LSFVAEFQQCSVNGLPPRAAIGKPNWDGSIADQESLVAGSHRPEAAPRTETATVRIRMHR